MHESVREFIKTAKANLLATANKLAIEPVYSVENHTNTIFEHANYIHLTSTEHEKISIALNELEHARGHLVGALASLQDFDGISKRDLLIAANLTHGHVHMLQEFINMRQARSAKPVKGLVGLKEAVANV